MRTDPNRDESPATRWLGIATVIGVLLAASASFLPSQTLWLDEATQMSGLSLGPTSVVRWPAGAEAHDFGQFPDRMPPGSYWVGWSWAKAFGPGEASLRGSGVGCVAMAAGLVYEASREAFGTLAGRAAGLMFATSPVVVVIEVEIRAYPLFLLGSAAAFSCLARLAEGRPDRRGAWMAGLAARAIALGLGAGVGAVLFGELALARGNFVPSSPSYNLWMKPGLCILLSAGLAAGSRVTRRAALVASVAMVGAQGVGLAQLWAHGSHFAHGSHRAMADLIRSLGPGEVAIVHDDPAHLFPFVSRPLRFEFGPALEQFRSLDASRVTHDEGPGPAPAPARQVASLPHRYLLVIRPESTGPLDLARQIRSGDRPILPGPIARSLAALGTRRLVHHEQHIAQIAVREDVFERSAR